MKLSEAIVLGSTCIKLTPYFVLLQDFDGLHGCAIGAALYSRGYRSNEDVWERKIPADWHWLKNTPPTRPALCHCSPDSDERLRLDDYRGYLTHYFNEHVMLGGRDGRKIMTLDQLVDWVRSVEPLEPVSTSTEGRDPVCSEPAEMVCRK